MNAALSVMRVAGPAWRPIPREREQIGGGHVIPFPKFTPRLRRILAARDTGAGWRNLTHSEKRRARELAADGWIKIRGDDSPGWPVHIELTDRGWQLQFGGGEP